MSGIYIHVPFCRKACYYCNFHFSTSMKYKQELLAAIQTELEMRRKELASPVQTIYFGGGTPSLLSVRQLESILNSIYKGYEVKPPMEITVEMNPDDMRRDYLSALKSLGINRVSVGVQSFDDEFLKPMNRSHTAKQAFSALEIATQMFDNVSIDLIYGFPDMTLDKWKRQIDTALSFRAPHVSAYALTVEPQTALHRFISKGRYLAPSEEQAQAQYIYLKQRLEAQGYVHYEISNFGKDGFFSRANTAYWTGVPYLGIGPSAHSFDGRDRSANVSNNIQYIRALTEGRRPCTVDLLSDKDRYNEAVMTGLRTMWGVSLPDMASRFGRSAREKLIENAEKYLSTGLLRIENDCLKLTEKGLFLADGIASDLFLV